jgi:hypothetical protein
MGVCKAGIFMAFDHEMFRQGSACIKQIKQQDFAGWDAAIYVIDVGLDEPERKMLTAEGIAIYPADDLAINFIGAPPYAKAQTCRPYLPDRFPGFDVYMWVDADVRLVTRGALAAYLNSAGSMADRVVLVQELDPTYGFNNNPAIASTYHALNRERLTEVYGQRMAELFNGFVMFNSGIFAIHRTSTVWSSFRRNVERAVQTPYHHTKEQDALNVAIFENNMAVSVLPTTYNWICSLSRPIYSSAMRCWVRPTEPHTTVHVLHLTASTMMVETSGVRQPMYEVYRMLGYTP